MDIEKAFNRLTGDTDKNY